jgi:hypothetical protein
MSEFDSKTDQMQQLFQGIGGEYSLEESRYAFRKLIYFGAMKLLRDFPEIVIGPEPMQADQGRAGGHPEGSGSAFAGGHGVLHPVDAGQPPPFRPSDIGRLLCIALGNCPPQS